MRSTKSARRSTAEPIPENSTGIPWEVLLFAISVVALFFQLFPSLWWGLIGVFSTVWDSFVAVVDVRNWTWKVCATLCALAIVALVTIRGWLANR